MKTSINPEGQLLVVAENATEAYALRQWWEKFDRSVADTCPTPGATSSISVDDESYAGIAEEKRGRSKPAMSTWRGKDVRTLDKEQLIEVISYLSKETELLRNDFLGSLRPLTR